MNYQDTTICRQKILFVLATYQELKVMNWSQDIVLIYEQMKLELKW